MKLYGGRRRSKGKDKKPLSSKNKIIISSILIVLALITTGAAVAMNHIKPPDAGNAYGDDTPPEAESGEIVSSGGVRVLDSSRREDFFTVLIAGRDAASMSTDTILLAAFDTAENTMNIMSIPRDTIVNTKRYNKKINAAYSSAGKDITALADEVASVTGVRPDRFALITVDGFVELIDAIGGVTLDVPIDMYYKDPTQNLVIDIDKGLQTLDGYDSMGFMRYRATYAEGDLGRIKMQHMFIDALVKEILTPSTFMKVPELARIVSENIETDLSLGNIVWLGKRLVTMDTETNVRLHTLPGYAKYYDGLSYYFPNEEEVLAVVNEFYNPYTVPIDELDLFKQQTKG